MQWTDSGSVIASLFRSSINPILTASHSVQFHIGLFLFEAGCRTWCSLSNRAQTNSISHISLAQLIKKHYQTQPSPSFNNVSLFPGLPHENVKQCLSPPIHSSSALRLIWFAREIFLLMILDTFWLKFWREKNYPLFCPSFFWQMEIVWGQRQC